MELGLKLQKGYKKVKVLDENIIYQAVERPGSKTVC
jgi:hypothetical protein